MKHYRYREQTIEVPFVPKAFLPAVANRAETGALFPHDGGFRARVLRMRGEYIRLRVSDEAASQLRFNRLEIWAVNDHTIRYRVRATHWIRATAKEAYWVYFADLPMFIMLSFAETWFPQLFPSYHDADGYELYNQPVGPALRPIGKRLKEIAAELPV